MISKFLKVLKTYLISFQIWTSKETYNFEFFLKFSILFFVLVNFFTFCL